jgi:hypothetical protein
MKWIIVHIILFGCFHSLSAPATEYAVARTATPVLNISDFKAVFGGVTGHELKTDSCGQVRELEFIALPGTVFTVLHKFHSGSADIYQVATDEYPVTANNKLYIDGRFITSSGSAIPKQRKPVLPERNKVLTALKVATGAHYVWGGNILSGVAELAALYDNVIPDTSRERLTLAGLDCSGLLYHATGGWTPRNTSQLISLGQGVAIAGKQPSEIAALLQPLDLITWNGHVIIVLDQHTAIESRLQCGTPGNGGVVVTPLLDRITAVMRTRRPVNAWPGDNKHHSVFVVRRWYP